MSGRERRARRRLMLERNGGQSEGSRDRLAAKALGLVIAPLVEQAIRNGEAARGGRGRGRR